MNVLMFTQNVSGNLVLVFMALGSIAGKICAWFSRSILRQWNQMAKKKIEGTQAR